VPQSLQIGYGRHASLAILTIAAPREMGPTSTGVTAPAVTFCGGNSTREVRVSAAEMRVPAHGRAVRGRDLSGGDLGDLLAPRIFGEKATPQNGFSVGEISQL
jgi:hypothetical protein